MKKHNDFSVRWTAVALITIAGVFPVALAAVGIEGKYKKCTVKVQKDSTGIKYVIGRNH